MTLSRLLVMVVSALLLLAVWWLGGRPETRADQPGPLLPEAAASLARIDRIELLAAGETTRVTLQRAANRWTVTERDGWPAHQGLVDTLLRELGQARRIEGKTRDPARYPRLAVEAVSAPDAGGLELRLSGAGEPLRLVLGDMPAIGEHRFVRWQQEEQAWRVDRAFDFPEQANGWLDRRLIDRPLARIERVQVEPGQGKHFALNRFEANFGLDSLPPAALAEPDRGDATAAVLDALELDDVADDSGQVASQRARFVGIDGLDVSLEAWSQDAEVWARCSARLDETRARAWIGQAPQDEADGDARWRHLQEEAALLQSRCTGKVFRLPEYKARNLMRSREQYLAG